MAVDEIMDEVARKNVEFIRLQFVDIEGKVKSIIIHARELEDAIDEGIGFDGSSVPGYAGIERSDTVLLPDLETFNVLSWKPQGKTVARFFCEVCYPNGTPHEGDPRYVLDRVMDRAKRKGYGFFVGTEMEYYIFRKENGKMTPLDSGTYLDFEPHDKLEELRIGFATALEEQGFIIETIHHEVGPGQNEVDFRFSDALTTADNVITCKQTLESLAEKKGLKADFSPKPLPDKVGNGLHCHQSLMDPETEKNLFFDPSGENNLSDTAYYYIGGLLAHSQALTALAAPTPKSYERLKPGFEAPVYVCWGKANRSTLIRIPEYQLHRGKGTRLEFRAPDPMCNPYLLFAAMLAAGLDGIKKEMDPGRPITENVYELGVDEVKKRKITVLPRSLEEALDAFEKDNVIKEALGKTICKNYVELKSPHT